MISAADLEEGYYTGEVDAYSQLNGIDTTYTIGHGSFSGSPLWNSSFNYYTLKCKRKSNDILTFFTFEANGKIVKVGQLPSLADLQFGDLGKKYKKMLSREDLQLYKKAIGLAAHGVGAGSFVYLRRIFEKLIHETYNEHKNSLEISESEFTTKRMTEKIEILKDYLPSQLVEMKSIYSILSSGVHELSEDQCLAYFPALKLSIELILDQQIEIEKKKQQDAAVKRQLEQIKEQLGTKQKKADR